MGSMTIGIIYANGIMEEMLMVNLYIYRVLRIRYPI